MKSMDIYVSRRLVESEICWGGRGSSGKIVLAFLFSKYR